MTVYGREDFATCAMDMIAALGALQPEYRFTLEVVDVDEDETLERQYGHLVPVLAGNGEEICRYHLDPGALAAYFGKIR
ncbi:MAG: glutaredoxin family protein [Sulfuricella sp.]